MPLDRYGVLSGTLHRHFRDQPDTQGRWFHVNLEVDAPSGRYRCAVDVDSKQSATGVQWRTLTLPAPAPGPVAALPPGYHDLARTAESGALDFVRHPALSGRRGCTAPGRPPSWSPGLLRLLRLLGLADGLTPRRRWASGSNLDAARALEPILVPGRTVLVYGEPFDRGLGMHNIHQNQGDPHGSQWWDENGVWQDGATLTRRDDGRYDVFLSKFSTQADRTDDDGHPV
ncbi:DUF2278 family protein [Streptomyces sp. HNM0663]|uniref:DUF2278 family protein n=1 Tax=Streptomyces chengmaiensis TaxID=3040919 RepID=A0ABT6HUW8_9ACTN|nr:DUF2278 family protein [Streptomyces chengmaiensis]MDH2392512.1 DUF2278 family protein [Streptomyces chengmaiensis]